MLLGSTEAIEDLGINVNVALLTTTEAFKNLSNGLSWDKLDFQTQQYIRMMAIMEQANRKFGSSVPINPMMMFRASLDNLKLALGRAFLPIVYTVLPIITAFINAMATAVSFIAQVINALLGFGGATASIEGTMGAVSDLGGGISDLGEDYSSALGDVEDFGTGMDRTASAVDKAAKKIKGSLLGLDEINVLKQTDPNVDGLNGGSGGGKIPKSSIPALTTPALPSLGQMQIPNFSKPMNQQFMEVSEGARRMAEMIKGAFAPFAPRLTEIFNGIKSTLGAVFSWIYTNVIAPLVKFLALEVSPRVVMVLAEALNVLNQIAIAMAPALKWLWDHFFAPIASWTGGVILKVLDGIIIALKWLGDWIASHQTLVMSIGTAILIVVGAMWAFNTAISAVTATVKIISTGISLLSSAFAFITSPVGIAIAAIAALIYIGVKLYQNWDEVSVWLGQVWERIKETGIRNWDSLKTTLWNIWEAIRDGAIKVWGAIADFFVNLWKEITEAGSRAWTAFTKFLGDTWQGAVNLARSIWGGLTQFFSNLWNGITSGVQNIWNGITTFLTNSWNKTVQVAGNIWGGLTNFFGSVWNAITTGVSNAWNGIGSFLGNIWSNIYSSGITVWNNLVQGISSIFGGLQSWFGDVWNGIIGTFSWAINAISGAFNSLIDYFFGGFSGNWANFWNWFVSAVSGAFNGLVDAVKWPINQVLTFINWLVSGWNSMRFEFGGLQGFGQQLIPPFSFGLPQLPTFQYLAKGGIVDGATPAIIGEAGAEAVVPLENNTEWIDKLADKFVSKMPGGSSASGGGSYRIVIQNVLDGTIIGEKTVDYINDRTMLTGRNPIVGID